MNSKKDNYIKDLENVISKFLTPLKDIPFSIAMKAVSGCNVISFNKDQQVDRELLEQLIKAMNLAMTKAYEKGIYSNRPNEVGNHIEPFVIDAINSIGGMFAEIPRNSKNRKQVAGYPDIFIRDIDKRITYLECKTYNKKVLVLLLELFTFNLLKILK